MPQHVSAAAKDEKARVIALKARLLSNEMRRQIVIEFVDADSGLSSVRS
jgi:hypothetical protein